MLVIFQVLVMMIGELEYDDLMYSEEQKIEFGNYTNGSNHTIITGDVVSEVQSQYYPFSAHVLVLLFIILFSIIIMNLLFGLAVSDVQVKRKIMTVHFSFIRPYNLYRN